MATAKKSEKKAEQKPEWTQAHQDAFDALRTMKVPEKEARKHLEGLPPGEAGDLMRQALRARSGAVVRKPQIPAGGPQNAMPVLQGPPPLPAQLPKNMPPLPSAQQPPPQKRDALENLIQFMTGGGKRPPNAPISPAVAQLSPPSMVATSGPERSALQGGQAPTEKPRIRIRAAGGPVPPAPIGATPPSVETSSPTNAPTTPTAAPQTPSKEAPLPRIRSEEEYEKLAPGTEFVWVPDGHIYSKPAKGGE